MVPLTDGSFDGSAEELHGDHAAVVYFGHFLLGVSLASQDGEGTLPSLAHSPTLSDGLGTQHLRH